MKLAIATAALALSALSALAQSAPEQQVNFLSKALSVLQQQRNEAMDKTANAQAEAAMLREAVAAMQEQIKKLTPSEQKKEGPQP